MALRPAFPWPGSKGRLAPWIVSLLRPSSSYLEPFAGTAAVLLAKPRCRLETLNDLDRNVVAFFRTLRDRPAELQRVVGLTPFAEAEFQDCCDPEPDASMDDLERARRFFVFTAQRFIGSDQWPNWGMNVDSTGHTDLRATKWLNLQARFEAVADRLQGVQIASRDALQLLERFVDEDDLTIYADPPYAAVRVRYRNHADELHEPLAALLRRAKGHVLVSGYPGLYDELYAGWQRIERPVLATGGSSLVEQPDGTVVRRRGGQGLTRTEVLWSNRQTYPGIDLDG